MSTPTRQRRSSRLRKRAPASPPTHRSVYEDSESFAPRVRDYDDDDDDAAQSWVSAADKFAPLTSPYKRSRNGTPYSSPLRTFTNAGASMSADESSSGNDQHDSAAGGVHGIIEAAQQRRVGAREAIEFLQSGANPCDVEPAPLVAHATLEFTPPPPPSDTPLGRRANLEANVAIDESRFDALLRDEPRNFQSAYKPPWAPALAPQKVAELQLWEKMEVLSELELMKQPWFSLVTLVAGLIQVPLSALVVRAPTTASTQAVRPTYRNRYLESFSLPSTNALDALRTGDLDTYAQLTTNPNGGGDDAKTTSFQQQQEPLLPPQTLLQINELLLDAVLNEGSAGGNGAQTVQSGARFERLRARAAAVQPAVPSTPVTRAALANAHEWAGRPTATGVYFLTPAYTSARDVAHTKITSRAPQLANVPLAAFARDDGRTDSAQRKVRVNFANLIADVYNMARHNSNRSSSKLASDAENLSASGEDTLKWFIYRVRWNAHARRFVVHSSNQPIRAHPNYELTCATGTGVVPFVYRVQNPLLYTL